MTKKPKRLFFKTVVQMEVLSEDVPPEFDNPSELWKQCIDGGLSGVYEVVSIANITAKQCAKELAKQGSDPEFFQLDEKGNDLEKEI